MRTRISVGLPLAGLVTLATVTLFGGHAAEADSHGTHVLTLPGVTSNLDEYLDDVFADDLDGYLLTDHTDVPDGAYLPDGYTTITKRDGSVVVGGVVRNQTDDPQSRAHIQVDFLNHLGDVLKTIDGFALLGTPAGGEAPFQILEPIAPLGVAGATIQVIGVDPNPAPLHNNLLVRENVADAGTLLNPLETGTLRNTGDTALGFIVVNTTTLNEQGAVIGTTQTRLPGTLAPGETVPYTVHLPFSDTGQRRTWIQAFEVDPDDQPTDPFVFSGAGAVENGRLRFVGEVVNSGPGAQNISVAFQVFDGDTQIVTVPETTVINIVPAGGRVPFVHDAPILIPGGQTVTGFNAAVTGFDPATTVPAPNVTGIVTGTHNTGGKLFDRGVVANPNNFAITDVQIVVVYRGPDGTVIGVAKGTIEGGTIQAASSAAFTGELVTGTASGYVSREVQVQGVAAGP